ncbi:MAG: hypothetical protein ACYC3G_00025 [Minisyncoccota bacterium]
MNEELKNIESNINISQSPFQTTPNKKDKQNNSLDFDFSKPSKFYRVLHWIIVLILSYLVLNSVLNIFWFIRDYINGQADFINVFGGTLLSFYTLITFYLVLKKKYFGYVALIFLSTTYLIVIFNTLLIGHDLFGPLKLTPIITNLLIQSILVTSCVLIVYVNTKNNKKEIEKRNKEGAEITKISTSISGFSRFIIVFLFLHFLLFILGYGSSVTSLIGGKNEIIILFELIIAMLSWFSVFGIYENKIWGYILTIPVLIASGISAFILIVLAGWGGASGWLIYFLDYLYLIHPILLLMTFIFSLRMILRLYKK